MERRSRVWRNAVTTRTGILVGIAGKGRKKKKKAGARALIHYNAAVSTACAATFVFQLHDLIVSGNVQTRSSAHKHFWLFFSFFFLIKWFFALREKSVLFEDSFQKTRRCDDIGNAILKTCWMNREENRKLTHKSMRISKIYIRIDEDLFARLCGMSRLFGLSETHFWKPTYIKSWRLLLSSFDVLHVMFFFSS